MDDDVRWAQVRARDASADGVFWYSVETTGVYCRPSCPSRPALRAHVAFHESVAAAEAAGFRACRRCRPDLPMRDGVNVARIAAACRAIERAETMPSLGELARGAKLSPAHFHRVFLRIVGVTPKEYGDAQRAARVRAALDGGCGVTEAIYRAGFNSGGRFYAQSAATLGMTPSRFRAGGVHETLRFAVGVCQLGSVLVAASPVGVAAILLGDDPDVLVRDLQDRFDRAELIGGDAGFEAMVARVIGLIEAPERTHDLPLDIRGTAFQHAVWQALRRIPAGRTATYGEIAAAVGRPGAVRAVAGACAANPLAVAVPCHRVIRQDGALSGYRWGVERKRMLLAREAERTAGTDE